MDKDRNLTIEYSFMQGYTKNEDKCPVLTCDPVTSHGFCSVCLEKHDQLDIWLDETGKALNHDPELVCVSESQPVVLAESLRPVTVRKERFDIWNKMGKP